MSLSYLSAIFKARESLQTKRDQKHRHIAYSIAYGLVPTRFCGANFH